MYLPCLLYTSAEGVDQCADQSATHDSDKLSFRDVVLVGDYPVSYTHLCILHMRRIATLHEGLRWPDIKRYGIVIYRRSIANNNIVCLLYTSEC